MRQALLTLLAVAGRALAVSVLACSSSPAWAETYTTASQAGVPFKFDWRNADKPGLCIEVMQALTRTDPELRFVGIEQEMPLKRVESELASGELDVFFGLIKTPERHALMFIESPALYAVRHQVAVRASDTVQVNTLDDIRKLGKEGLVLTTQGTAYPHYLDDFAGLYVDTSTSNNSQLFKMLLAGRGRFFYQGDSTLRSQIKTDGLEAMVRILPAVFKIDSQLVAHAPSLSAGKLRRLRLALEQLEKSGELAKLRAKYGLS
jgi:ABC-type amino acid transport substrate-binding protein